MGLRCLPRKPSKTIQKVNTYNCNLFYENAIYLQLQRDTFSGYSIIYKSIINGLVLFGNHLYHFLGSTAT